MKPDLPPAADEGEVVGVGGRGRVIVGTYDWNNGSDRGWNLGDRYWDEDHLRFSISDGDGNVINAEVDNFFADYKDKWVHVLGVFRPGKEVALYINGNLMDSVPTTITQIASNGTPLRIGARADWARAGLWSGLIDEVRIFDRVLTDSEIAAELTLNDPVQP